jgi:hypothetical protein
MHQRSTSIGRRILGLGSLLVACWSCSSSQSGIDSGSGNGPSIGGAPIGSAAGQGTTAAGGTAGDGGTTSIGGAATSIGGADSGGGGSNSGANACAMGTWPAVDPATAGPFATVTETNVGPTAGVGAAGGPPVAFTLFRPKDMAQSGLCHPVVTWGNGTGSKPSMYGTLLGRLASHGFVVIASDSPNVAQGSPAPMVAGVTWVLEQNGDPTSAMYQRIDTTHVGATGHSQGGFATTSAGADSHITTIAPLCGASSQRNLHGPALLLCGGNDTTVPCDGMIKSAFDGITNQPVMLADYLTADHANWITFRGTTLSAMEVAVVAWMRVHLMADAALRPWFYGASCKLCQDAAWKITQKTMAE